MGVGCAAGFAGAPGGSGFTPSQLQSGWMTICTSENPMLFFLRSNFKIVVAFVQSHALSHSTPTRSPDRNALDRLVDHLHVMTVCAFDGDPYRDTCSIHLQRPLGTTLSLSTIRRVRSGSAPPRRPGNGIGEVSTQVQGSTKLRPIPSKCRRFLVAKVPRRSSAIAAIRVSRTSTGRPARRCLAATIPAVCAAA